MKTAREEIIHVLQSVVDELSNEHVEVSLSVPEDLKNGDYTSNIGLILSKKLGKAPREIAEDLKFKIVNCKLEILERVEVAGAGFINFYLSQEYLASNLSSILDQKETYGNSGSLKDKKIMLEFADPNPFKEFHIGHLRNIAVGESYARLFESQEAQVWRVNYQGDVGMHVAKALWGMKSKLASDNLSLESLEKEPLAVRAKFLGESYALGAAAFEEDEIAKTEIKKLNVMVYKKDPEVADLWEKGRSWSLQRFEELYKKVGTVYKRYYFESEVADKGREIVLDNVKNGIFEKDQGAVVYKGGDHVRVFITSEDYATYEAKDMALAGIKYADFPYDRSVIITAHEQAPYFKVVLSAMKKVFPDLAVKTEHDSFGFVDLKDGKMSSRTGKVITGEWLLTEAKNRIMGSYPDISEDTAEQIAVGAVKYSMLKVGREANISFSFEDSINLHGNSGPYIQYAYARTQSILSKVDRGSLTVDDKGLKLEHEEETLLRTLIQFPEVVSRSQFEFAPNYICTYLFDLTQKFSLFYEKHRVIGEDKNIQDFRIALVSGVGQVLKNGLHLLGIASPEKI